MPTILIVEDNALVRNEIQKLINSMGNNVKVMNARNGNEALQIADHMSIDVFVIDIGLPDCDGIELSIQLRRTYPHTPIIIESSNCDSIYKNKVHDQIENLAFLTKPFSASKLIAKITHALNLADILSDSILKIRQNNYLRVIKIKEIIYIEKIKGQKKIAIATYSDYKKSVIIEEFSGCSLRAILDIPDDKKELLRCHKSYAINPKMIERLNYGSDTISLKYTEREIPIGKTFKNTVALLL